MGDVGLLIVACGLCPLAGGGGKVFFFMALVLGKSFRFLFFVYCPQVFGMALVFMLNAILPESYKKVYYGRVGSQPQLASLQVHAQQSVHLTLGILPVFQAVSYALAFFWLDGFAVPVPAQVTQAVGRLNKWM